MNRSTFETDKLTQIFIDRLEAAVAQDSAYDALSGVDEAAFQKAVEIATKRLRQVVEVDKHCPEIVFFLSVYYIKINTCQKTMALQISKD